MTRQVRAHACSQSQRSVSQALSDLARARSAGTSLAGEHTDEFYRGIQHINIVIGSNNGGAVGIHWAQSQATHIRNVSISVGSGKSGMFMENGSGGFIGDLSVDGGEWR